MVMETRQIKLPINPTDGQVYIDSEFVRWAYDASNGVWERRGVVNSIPLATDQIIGYLSPQDKNLINSVPATPGGFGIITDTKLLLKNQNNPDGIISGDIKLRSESLDIVCVGPDLVKLECERPLELECLTQNGNTPGLSFSLSDKFLSSLYIDLTGPKGPKGDKGEQGLTGETGFSSGPKGDQGQPGDDTSELCELTGISFNDIDGLTDTGIVDLDIIDNDGHGCKLIVTKAKLNIPSDRPADKLIASSLSRSVVYAEDSNESSCDVTRLTNWSLAQPPGDSTPLDIQLLRLAKGSNDRDDEPVGFNGTMALSGFVTDIVNEYQDRLVKLDQQWSKETRSHVEQIDDKARTILSNLAGELADCEFNLPAVEYCITLTGCDQPLPPPPPPPPPPSPDPVASGLASQRHTINQSFGGDKQFSQGIRKWNTK